MRTEKIQYTNRMCEASLRELAHYPMFDVLVGRGFSRDINPASKTGDFSPLPNLHIKGQRLPPKEQMRFPSSNRMITAAESPGCAREKASKPFLPFSLL
jgi:hypothetical protein